MTTITDCISSYSTCLSMHYNTIRDLLLLHFVFGAFVHSRFVKSVSDEELKSLVENQENVNTKNNTKWAINVFNKWREQRMEDIRQVLHFLKDKMFVFHILRDLRNC
jgi:hypothetical protein